MAGMAVLFTVSKRNNGLTTVDDRYYYALETPGSGQPRVSIAYYAWAYGPTAIFTILAAYWSQVDYHVRQITPWKQMAKKQSPAERSILIDYVSPSAPIVLFQSLKASHFLTFFVATGSILMKLMVILSIWLVAQIDAWSSSWAGLSSVIDYEFTKGENSNQFELRNATVKPCSRASSASSLSRFVGPENVQNLISSIDHLAAMAVFMGATYFFIDTKELIPKNPCSIAAVASLLADSELLGHVRVALEEYGGQDMSFKQLEEKVFEGMVPRMGWWGKPENRRFGIDVGQADEDR